MRPVAIALISLIALSASSGGLVSQETPSAFPCETPPKGTACIPGGPFIRGSNDGPSNSRPESTVWIQTFYMDLYEVTYEDYGRCMAQGKCNKAGPNYSDFDHPKQPITGVDWYDSVKYCEAHGKHLPTEAEWEKAARGQDGWIYPWGNDPATCDRAVYKNEKGRSCGVPKVGKRPDKGRPFDVGSKPHGVYGLYDMAGNSWEWVNDWYTKNWTKCGEDCSGVDPKGPCQGKVNCPGYHRKIVRGGSWYWEAELMTGFYRRSHVPDNSPFHHFGFRCAASVEEARELTKSKAK